MDKTFIFSIVGIVFLIVVIFFFIKNRKKSDDNSMEEFIITEEDNKSSQKKEPEINITATDFKVVGNKDKYTISFKGDKIQFFVKDNEIIGFLDVEKNSKIYYYEKAKVKEGEDKNV
ncbi:hypothetical protein LDK18_03330 [Fusobacterium nucleatum subsp. nucleatum ATCC 23726]|uniref:Uncharacterized protein n=2 Tax=Fusobacterium nucleatum subsp. nucleatum TaxID=76856 RepID=A0A0M5MFV6_FUSNC|nr:hypothetical protein [Fusobacterium nucleatum]ALF24490.1 hypothetical protein RO05_08955 [Fusobacterium nucleatum subsp. nucleatum ChDC F316]ALF25551.1 hypothetical protein RN95_03510 [Fusobacterium nucleatum subsp. nucleatum]ASG26248.1 hypothetical protein RN84_04920 [Fusobacterium nucleatum subsp. nucleatum]EFG95514.1 hypothetical protein HMPREF0397_0940 [Fusobacterium nucleatum subsp. nucleatum ATCC 23726]KUL98873.1 hypothetical protein RO03_04895 [Fusobacterium nucleatum subsp. nucleatu